MKPKTLEEKKAWFTEHFNEPKVEQVQEGVFRASLKDWNQIDGAKLGPPAYAKGANADESVSNLFDKMAKGGRFVNPHGQEDVFKLVHARTMGVTLER